MLEKTSNIAIIILAAGASSRMKEPKQLLSWGDNTLLEHVIKTVMSSDAKKVVVVLGANYKVIEKKIKNLPVNILKNNNWKLGIGQSIAYGVSNIIESNEDMDGVLIILADQPLVDSVFLNAFLNHYRSNKNQIIATSYREEKIGVPVLFDKAYFKELALLSDDEGAKTLLKKYNSLVEVLKPKQENLDIDSKADYNHLLKSYFK